MAAICALVRPAMTLSIWPITLSSVPPASRSSSVSPTQAIGVMPCFWIADTLAATMSSVSPNSSRRSLCPAMTYLTSSLARNTGDTSPVNAPLSSQWQC